MKSRKPSRGTCCHTTAVGSEPLSPTQWGFSIYGLGSSRPLWGVVDHYWPAAQIMTTYAWQIPVWALAAVAAVRLLLAPYWMWSAQRDQTSALEAKVNDGTRNHRRDKWLQDAVFRIINGRWPGTSEKSLPQMRDNESTLDWKNRVRATPEYSKVENALLQIRQAARDGSLTIWALHSALTAMDINLEVIDRQRLFEIVEPEHWSQYSINPEQMVFDKEQVHTLKGGWDPLDSGSVCSPMVSEAQIEQLWPTG